MRLDFLHLLDPCQAVVRHFLPAFFADDKVVAARKLLEVRHRRGRFVAVVVRSVQRGRDDVIFLARGDQQRRMRLVEVHFGRRAEGLRGNAARLWYYVPVVCGTLLRFGELMHVAVVKTPIGGAGSIATPATARSR